MGWDFNEKNENSTCCGPVAENGKFGEHGKIRRSDGLSVFQVCPQNTVRAAPVLEFTRIPFCVEAQSFRRGRRVFFYFGRAAIQSRSDVCRFFVRRYRATAHSPGVGAGFRDGGLSKSPRIPNQLVCLRSAAQGLLECASAFLLRPHGKHRESAHRRVRRHSEGPAGLSRASMRRGFRRSCKFFRGLRLHPRK